MKKLFLILATFIFASGLMAQEEGGMMGRIQLTFFGGGGFSYVAGNLPGGDDKVADLNDELGAGTFTSGDIGEAETNIGGAYQFGVGLTLFMTDQDALNFTVSSTYKDIPVKWKKGYDTEIEWTIHGKFTTFSVGYRNYSPALFYWGLGVFYAMKQGTWEQTRKFISDDPNKEGEATYDIEDKLVNDDYGIYLELGATIPMNDILYIDILAKLEGGIANVYEKDDPNYTEKLTLNAKSFMLLAGISLTF